MCALCVPQLLIWQRLLPLQEKKHTKTDFLFLVADFAIPCALITVC